MPKYCPILSAEASFSRFAASPAQLLQNIHNRLKMHSVRSVCYVYDHCHESIVFDLWQCHTDNTCMSQGTDEDEVKAKGGRGIKSANPRKVLTVGVKTSEFAEFKAIAEKHGVAVNAVLLFFLRTGLTKYREGSLKIPTVTTKKIKMP